MLITKKRQAEKLAQLKKQGEADKAEQPKANRFTKPRAAPTLITKQRQHNKLAAALKDEIQTEQRDAVLASQTTAPMGAQLAVVDESLKRDLAALKELTAVDDKVALKRELLPKYQPFVTEYLQSGANYQNHVLFYVALWSLDVGEIGRAFELFDVIIEQQQSTPDHFNRDLPTLAAEAISDWAERQLKAGDSASPYIDDVFKRIQSKAWLVSQIIVVGKVAKVAGLHCQEREEFKEALAYFEAAQNANDKAGVKTRIDKLKRQLNVE